MIRAKRVTRLDTTASTAGRGWRLLVAMALVSAAALAGGWYYVRALEAHLLRTEVQAEAWRWAGFLRDEIPNIDGVLQGDFLTSEDQRVLDFAIKAGEIFRYKAFGPAGRITLATRNSDLGKLNTKPYFLARVMKGEGYAKLVDNRGERVIDANTEQQTFAAAREVIGEAYAPIMDGLRFQGAIEVYVDMTVAAEHARQQGNEFLLGLGGLLATVLALVGGSVALDVRGRRRVERRLAGAARSMDTAQRIAGVGNWELNLATGELRCSDETLRIFALDPRSAEGAAAALAERVHPGDREAVDAAVHAALRGEAAYDHEHRLLLPGGDERVVHEQAAVTHDPDGTPVRLHGATQDVTARKQAEAERERLERDLRQAQRLEALGTLAGGIAHEINTPSQYVGDNLRFLGEVFQDLQAVIAKAEAMVESARTDGVLDGPAAEVAAAMEEADIGYQLKEVPVSVEQSLEGIERIREIVLAVKEFAYPDVKEKVPVGLNQALATTATVAGNQWKALAELETEFAADLPQVTCLPGEINQVFLNLIVNAAHAIEASEREGPGHIRLCTRAVGEAVEIRVEDDGTGIGPEHVDRVFDWFYTTKAPGKGSGQGLAVSYGIVTQKHGGTLTVESEKGRGTVFTVTLPVSPPAGLESPPPLAVPEERTQDAA